MLAAPLLAAVALVMAVPGAADVGAEAALAGAVGGVYSLPTGGPQIAGASFDLSGTTKLGTKLLDHSYFVPMLVLSGTTMLVGSAIGTVFF